MSVQVTQLGISVKEELALGAVSSSSNANGDWIKYEDGMLIQWGETVSTGAKTFPLAFIDTTYAITLGSRSSTSPYVTGKTITGYTLNAATADYVAIGRWKL